MKRNIFAALRAWFAAALLFSCPALAGPADAPQPPSVVFRGLFEDVQRSGIFPDSKTFADATATKARPRRSWPRIRASAAPRVSTCAASCRNTSSIPVIADTAYVRRLARRTSARTSMRLWPVLTRGPDTAAHGSSLLPLPHRYVVPGGRFREVTTGIRISRWWASRHRGRHDLVLEMIEQLRVAHRHVRAHSERQPDLLPEPVAAAVLRRDGRVGRASVMAKRVYRKSLPQLEREYQFWMEGAATLARGPAHRRVVETRGWHGAESLLGRSRDAARRSLARR